MITKFCFNTNVLDSAGNARYSVFETDDGGYKCMQIGYTGYLSGPGDIVLKKVNGKWQGTPAAAVVPQLVSVLEEWKKNQL